MNRILIIDDEAHCRNVLVKHITGLQGENVKLETANDVSEGIKKINSFNPDVVLLDIRMNEGDGFDLLDQMKEINFQIIFTTAYNDYALKAFDYSAVHYLLKPVDKNELEIALKRCEEKQNTISSEKLSEIKSIYISTESLELNVHPKDICYVQADGSYSKIFMTGDKTIMTSKNIGEYEKLLPAYFFRVHKSFLINHKHIKEINSSNNTVSTHCNHSIPISRRRKIEFKDFWLNHN